MRRHTKILVFVTVVFVIFATFYNQDTKDKNEIYNEHVEFGGFYNTNKESFTLDDDMKLHVILEAEIEEGEVALKICNDAGEVVYDKGGAHIKDDMMIDVSKGTWNYEFNPSFSLNALGTWLDFHGYDVKLIDLLTDPMDEQEFIDYVTKEEILFLGISVHTENVNISKEAVKKIKKVKKDLVVVAGGAHSSLCPEELLEEEAVDFVAIDEGESTLVELCEALKTNEKVISFEDIPNLAYRKDETIVYTNPGRAIADMDLLPMPKRELFHMERYQKVINILSGRGCPGSCVYCAATVLSGKKYRSRSTENVFLEIVLLKYLFGEKVNVHLYWDIIVIPRKQWRIPFVLPIIFIKGFE